MKYKNYKNSITQDNRIYSRDDLLDLSLRQLRDNQDEYLSQYRSIGVPSISELQASENVVWVDEYIRDDGTKVRGHWRSKPDGNGSGIKGSIQKALSGDAVSGEEEGNPILNAIYEVLCRITNQESDGTEEGVPTGGAAGIHNGLSTEMNNGMRKCWDNKGNIYYEDISVIPKFGYQYSYTQNELIEYNNKKNWSYKDARDCMNIALIGPDNIQNTKEYRVISENRIIDLSKKTNFDIPKNLPVVEYSNDSSLAKSINNSDELKSQLKEWINNTNRQNDNLVQVEFTEPNLFRSLHNATLLNPKLENGYITGYIYDLYDFNYQNFDNFNTYKVNTGAVVLQNTNHLHNYRIIVPIKIKL